MESVLLNTREIEEMAGRDAFGLALEKLGELHEEIVVLGVDAVASTRCDIFEKRWPHRTFNFGIAEPNMIGAAAGFAIAGKIPICAAFAFLLAMRCTEQIRTDICYPNLNVKLITTATGLSMGACGPTHFCLEDLAILRSFPNMTIISASDNHSAVAALQTCVEDHVGPVYLRLMRGNAPVVHKGGVKSFEIGKAITLKEGNDATVIANGEPVHMALQAAQELEEEGINARVIDMHTVKPIDEETVREAAETTRGIVTVEEHSLIGGLGEAIASVVCENAYNTPVLKVAVPDVFCEIGPADELWSHYGLNPENIKAKVRTLCKKGSQ
jgi:transketolase